MKYIQIPLIMLASFLCRSGAYAQIPTKIFAGHKKVTFDVMFFKYFKKKESIHSKFLFFNRNRLSADYKMTSTSNLPAFGFTEAISYNDVKLKGFAPVAVAQISNRGVYPKAGMQYARIRSKLLIFSWVVCELKQKPTLDFFLLTRYEPKLSETLNLFTQLELINAFPTETELNYTFIQRLRLGLKIKSWQFGAGADFTEIGRAAFVNTNNIGGFLRHEF